MANLIEQSNGKRLGSRIALRLKFPAYYPPVGTSARPLQIRIGKAPQQLERSTLPAPPLRFCTEPSLPIERVPTGPPDRHRQAARAGHAWMWPMQLFLSLLIAFPTCLQHPLRFPAPISGNLYSKRYFPVMGGSSPLSFGQVRCPCGPRRAQSCSRCGS